MVKHSHEGEIYIQYSNIYLLSAVYMVYMVLATYSWFSLIASDCQGSILGHENFSWMVEHTHAGKIRYQIYAYMSLWKKLKALD
jgi:hypothetical protein